MKKLSNKKIAICINSLEKGGAERVVSILGNFLVKNNKVDIITMVNRDILYELDSHINVLSLAKKKNNIKNKYLNKFLKIPKFFVKISKLKKIFKYNNYDLIISFLPETSFITLFAAKKNDKVIVSDRNDPNVEYASFFYNFLMKKTYPKANGFVFQTFAAKEYFNNIIDFKNKKYDIIYNPVNTSFICDEYIGSRKKKIVSVGRLNEQKNFDLLIDAFNEVKDEFSDYTLEIYGEGDLRNHLEEKIKRYDLSNQVILKGLVSDVKKYIYDSSLFIMTSNYEGMPNALVEAMCLGLPVISTDCPCGGPALLIENNKNGRLVSVNNKGELVSAIKELLSNEKLREELGNNARKILDNVHPDIINKKWEVFILKNL